MRTTSTLLTLALTAGLAVPTAARAQFGRPPRTTAQVYEQHLHRIAFSRDAGAVLARLGASDTTCDPPPPPPGCSTETPGASYCGPGDISLVGQALARLQGALQQRQAEMARQNERAAQARADEARNIRAVTEWERQDRVRRAQAGAVPSEVASGWALNELLDEIRHRGDPACGPTVPVSADLLKRVNFAGTFGGGVGMFKVGQPIAWPEPFTAAAFQTERTRIEQILPNALREAAAGAPARPAVGELTQAVDALHDRLKQAGDSVPGTTYLRALGFLDQLDASAQALAQPTAPGLLNGSLAAAGATVPDLATDMANKGLKFAPATPGDEQAYAGLYQELLDYDTGLTRTASR